MLSFINTFKRLLSNQQKQQATKPEHSTEELLQWATGCMLEGLPDNFFQARLLCIREPNPLNPDDWIVNVNHEVMLSAESEYERFQPADDLYPTQCVEILLNDKEWHSASIVFNKEKTSFLWE
ncbi:hypothetical protein SNN58_000500 [Cronobacter dublinensis]|nr:hypothetical protein [Cronobacter dublinensis]ELY3969372.1 hypothetical protein [Cronobacter dublinensis]ELY4485353.1 hypothetical protein [Cronobacter dublinensis]ELY5822048.1 hypothetical protein [Cronobacter dublinensis]